MYLPLSSVTLLPLVQLPALLRNFVVPPPVVSPGDIPGYSLGELSPYHNALHDPDVTPDLPAGCIVNRVILLHRHGSRRSEAGQDRVYIERLRDTLALEGNAEIINEGNLPDEQLFLQGYNFGALNDNGGLTIVGRKELIDHGTEFARRYPKFSTEQVFTTGSDRVKESAKHFLRGLFGRGAPGLQEDESWLRPQCDKLSSQAYANPDERAVVWRNRYIPDIRRRLDRQGGIRFLGGGNNEAAAAAAVRGALYACAYDLAVHVDSPWCNLFEPGELKNFEYELDLRGDFLSGHRDRYLPARERADPGPFVGAIYVNKLIQRLTDEDQNPENLYLDFGHQTTILLVLSAMKLNKDTNPLSSTPNNNVPHPDRKFRTSNQVPFAAEMIWERFTCPATTGLVGQQVRLVLNRATFPLNDVCPTQTYEERRYGTCSVEGFVEGNAYSQGIAFQDNTWNAVCAREVVE